MNYQEMQTMFFDDINKKQSKLIKSLEGMGDILVLDVADRKNDRVKETLKIIHNILLKLMKKKKDNPEFFEKMLLHEDFFRLYKEDENEAKLRMSLYPEKYLISFSSAINQIIRVHAASLREKNEETSRSAAHHLTYLLAEFAQEPDNKIFIEQVLNNISNIVRNAVKNDDPSIYAASIHWYPDIVFNKMRQHDDAFRIEYLDVFDKYYFSLIKFIISRDKTNIFKGFVSTVYEGFTISSWDASRLWDYGHLILRRDFNKYKEIESEFNVEAKLKALSKYKGALDTLEKFNSWMKDYEEYTAIIDSNLSDLDKEEAQNLDRKIRGYVEEQFEYNNFTKLVFGVCAYCVFKNKPEYIKYLWEYKQPEDAEAVWVGHDIVPMTLSSLLSSYYASDLSHRKFDFWEEHHGSELYYSRYFVLLLTRIIRTISDDKIDDTIENFHLPKMDIFQLVRVEHSIESLLPIAKKLGENNDFILKLGILKEEDIARIFSERVIPFLQSLKILAKKCIINIQKEQSISRKRVDEFKKEIILSFYEEANLRYIFKYLSKYVDKTNETYEGEVKLRGINTLDDKAAYFDKWHISFVDWAENRGRQMAMGEDEQILTSIVSNCEESTMDNLDNLIRENPNVIIIATFHAAYGNLEDLGNFVPKWVPKGGKIPLFEGKELSGFQGWYKVDENFIPIIYSWNRDLDKGFIVLDKKNVGNFIQYSPLDSDKDKALKEGFFYISIIAFSDDASLLDRFISKPPDWLMDIGDEEAQKEYLKQRVLLNVYERFEFKPLEGQKSGYFIKMNMD